MKLKQLMATKYFYEFAGKVLPSIGIVTLLLFFAGLIDGLLIAPPDYQQGDAFRIMYVHVPSAFLSLFVYSFMAGMAFVSLIWRTKITHILTRSAAPIGAWFAFLALLTGAIWGKPMWGTFWIWDARLTSELILLFLYLGYISLHSAIPDTQAADKAGAYLLLVGVINIPIIHYSVYWWNSLHQGASISKFGAPSIAPSMLYPLLIMIAAFMSYFLLVLLIRARTEILCRLGPQSKGQLQ